MNAKNVLRFLGWAALTYSWLEANRIFFNAIADAINQHDEQIRQKAILEAKELLKQNDKSEMVVETVTETVTETISKS